MAELLTVGEAAEALGITEKAVRRRIERGQLQSVVRGHRRLVPAGEVERGINRSKVSAAAGEGQFPLAAEVVKVIETLTARVEELAGANSELRLLTQQAESREQINVETERRLRDELAQQRAEREQLQRQVEQLQAELEQAEQAQEVALVDARPSRRRWFARR